MDRQIGERGGGKRKRETGRQRQLAKKRGRDGTNGRAEKSRTVKSISYEASVEQNESTDLS